MSSIYINLTKQAKEHVLDIQLLKKKELGHGFSLEQSILFIILDHKERTDSKVKRSPSQDDYIAGDIP